MQLNTWIKIKSNLRKKSFFFETAGKIISIWDMVTEMRSQSAVFVLRKTSKTTTDLSHRVNATGPKNLSIKNVFESGNALCKLIAQITLTRYAPSVDPAFLLSLICVYDPKSTAEHWYMHMWTPNQGTRDSSLLYACIYKHVNKYSSNQTCAVECRTAYYK